MAKSKVPETPAGQQRIPLKEVTITWQRDSAFIGEKGAQLVTLTGEQLAPLLGWLTTVAPGNVDAYFDEDMTWRLPRIASAIRTLSDTDNPEEGVEGCSVVAGYLEDLAARIKSFRARAEIAEKAFVTIPTRLPKAVA